MRAGRRRPNVILALVTVVAALGATVIGLGLIASSPFDAIPAGYRPAEMLPFVTLLLAFTAVGALLVWRRPENVIAWLLCGQALTIAVVLLLAGQVVRALGAGDAGTAAAAAWYSAWLMNGLGLTIAPVLVLFPDGRAASLAARASLGCIALSVVPTTLVIAFRPGPLISFPAISNPYPWRDHGGALDALFFFGAAAGALGLSLTLWSQISRYRRSTGVERQQLKWFLASLVVIAVLLVPAVALLHGESEATASTAQRYAGRAIAALATTALPVAVAVAILRHRLYDIDVLINRALVYGAVMALLALTYGGAVIVSQSLLRPFTAGSELAVAASTLVVVAAFQPLRRRVQDLVDRRFYRSRYDAARTLDAFSARLRDEVDLDSVRADLLGAIQDTVRPAHATVWLRARR